MVLLPCVLWLLADFLIFFINSHHQQCLLVLLDSQGTIITIQMRRGCLYLLTLRVLHCTGFDPHVTE